MTQRKRLSDILANGQQESLRQAWDSTQAAEEFQPLPAGEYIARIEKGELFNAKAKGTAGYRLTFCVIEGEHEGRRFWPEFWLTAPALPMTKRDLGKLGVTSIDQLEGPLPEGIVCNVRLAVRKDDDGTERNRLRSFDVLRIEPPASDPFAPAVDAQAERDGEPQDGEGGEQ